MKKANMYIDHQKLKSSQKLSLAHSQDQMTLSRTLIEKIFGELGLVYGHLWNSLQANDEMWEAMKKKWAKELAGLDLQQIRRALDACLKIKYPPSLPEFLELAGRSSDRTHHGAYQEYKTPQLTGSVDKSVGTKYLDEIRKKLGMGARQAENATTAS